MADIRDPQPLLDEDLPAHLRTFHGFNRLVLFAILHIALIVSCLALAFPGHSPVLAAILGIGGTLALIAAFAILT